jgi:hypothetical protein
MIVLGLLKDHFGEGRLRLNFAIRWFSLLLLDSSDH